SPVDGGDLAAAAAVQTGAMIALIPREADAERLAMSGGEPAEQLHVTLFFLGESEEWLPEDRTELVDLVRRYAPSEPVYARLFGAAQWNPHSDSPAWVWSVGDNIEDASTTSPSLEHARSFALNALTE